MKILITGAAGFIGHRCAKEFIKSGWDIIAIDSITPYYDDGLKAARLADLGHPNKDIHTAKWEVNYSGQSVSVFYYKVDIASSEISTIINTHKPDLVLHLAAQAGVRQSISNPQLYVHSNVRGFINMIENTQQAGIKHFVYASSSSVYGSNSSVPFKTSDRTDNPISIYAATKKSNELIASTYSHIYNLRCTGLRFFTVYGEWGRPDMATFLFTKSILERKSIKVFNNGNLKRDFTYIGDIVHGIKSLIFRELEQKDDSGQSKIFNIGRGEPVQLLTFIETIESKLGIKANLNLEPMQLGDVFETYADVSSLFDYTGYKPKISIQEGVGRFVNWYKSYYNSSNE